MRNEMRDFSEAELSASMMIQRAANDNRAPKNKLIKKLILISLWVAPIIIWLLWLK
jgi:hypothetical protein